MKAWNTEPLVIETNCKTWSCKSCRNRKLNLIKQMIRYGLTSSATKAYLVSFTYSAPGPRREKTTDPVNAERAKKEWRALLLAIRKLPHLKNIAIFKVTELTKRLQIHHHTIMTGYTDERYKQGNCGDNPDWTKSPFDTCTCLRCTLSRLWRRVTATSHIVDVRRIYHEKGIATYLTSYLKKQMHGKMRDIMEERGFARRFSKTNNWLSSLKVTTAGTHMDAWYSTEFEYGHRHTNYAASIADHPLLERVGTPLALKMLKDSRRERLVIAFKTVV